MPERFLKLGYQGSNLEMTESESVALPFGDSPIFYFLLSLDCEGYYTCFMVFRQAFFLFFLFFFFTLLYVTVQEDDPPCAKPQGGQLYYFMSSAVSSPSNCIL